MPRKAKCKVFVSYSRHDEELVKPLAKLLGGVTAEPVFLDIDSIKPGELWEAEIEDAVRTSAVFVVCWCCQSEQSRFVRNEIRLAVAVKGKRLIPVLFCSRPLPRALSDRQWVDLSGRISHTCNPDQHPPIPRDIRGTEAEKERRRMEDEAEPPCTADLRSGYPPPASAPRARKINWRTPVVVLVLYLAAVLNQARNTRVAAPHSPGVDVGILLGAAINVGLIFIIGICGVLLYRRLKHRRRERAADKVAQTARQYFETLGGQETLNAPLMG